MKSPHKFVCPSCHEKFGVEIIYGMPVYDLFLAEERGEVVLGGCQIELDAPERQCLRCGYAWRIKRRGIPPQDFNLTPPKKPTRLISAHEKDHTPLQVACRQGAGAG